MLSIERTKELLADLHLSDEELEDIRSASWMLAAIAFDMWENERKEMKENERKTSSDEASGS